MDYRQGLHTFVELLADYGAFENRRVVIEIKNGHEIRIGYDPPLSEAVAPIATLAEKRLFGTRLQ